MDCSNPVKDSTRIRLGELYQKQQVYKRQDLAYLQALVANTERKILSAAIARAVPEEVVKAEWTALRESMPAPPSPSKEALKLDFLKVERKSTPVCGLLVEGRPLHPPGKFNLKGNVTTQRIFGGAATDWEQVQVALRYLEKEEVEKALATSVYTRGEASGFVKRLKEQTTRKCVSVVKTYGSEAQVQKALARLLPVDKSKLWDVREDLGELVERITTSAAASAGAPYWRSKAEVFEEMREVVLPLVHQALSEGTLGELRRDQPELFLVECKNKTDRYDPSRLEDKTRPYFSYPFHWSALFSVLSQSFTGAMDLFYERGANAYGFSWVARGTEKLVEWARQVGECGQKGGRPRFCAYGDDCDLYYRKGGVLYRVAPDFRQMDGSVDRDTVVQVLKYLLKAHTDQYGPEVADFWRQVITVWTEMATDPEFLVDGEVTYRKPQTDGLATGVVGTTLFDTAKAVLAYDKFVEQVHDFKQYHLLEETHAVAYFRTLGLEIKAGTWDPQPVVEEPAQGLDFSPHKFLGMKIRWDAQDGEHRPVPYLDEEDWWHLMLVPRTTTEAGKKVSHLAQDRVRFDRYRGLITTGAFSNERALAVLNAMINEVPGTPILMSVQAGGGRGEAPDYALFDPDGTFQYPTSEGVPTREWAWQLYTWDRKPEATFQALFPGASEKLAEYKRTWARMPTVARVVRARDAGPAVLALLPAPVEEDKVVVEMAPLSGKNSKLTGPVREKSANVDVVAKEGKLHKERQPRAPTRKEALTQWLTSGFTEQESVTLLRRLEEEFDRWAREGIEPEDITPASVDRWDNYRIVPAVEAARYLGCTEVEAVRAAKEAGFFVVGPYDSKWITPTPLDLPGRDAVDQAAQAATFAEIVRKQGLKAKAPELKQLARIKEQMPRPAQLPFGMVPSGPSPPRWPQIKPGGSPNLWERMVQTFNTVGVQLLLASRNVARSSGQEVELLVQWKDVKHDTVSNWFSLFGASRKLCRERAAEAVEEALLARGDYDLEEAGSWQKSAEDESRLEVWKGSRRMVRLVKQAFIAEPSLAQTEWRVEGGKLTGPIPGGTIILSAYGRRTLASLQASLEGAFGADYKIVRPKPPQPKPEQASNAWKLHDGAKERQEKCSTQAEKRAGGSGGSEPPRKAGKTEARTSGDRSSASVPLTGMRSSAQCANQRPYSSGSGPQQSPFAPRHPRRDQAGSRGSPLDAMETSQPGARDRRGWQPHNSRNTGGGMVGGSNLGGRPGRGPKTSGASANKAHAGKRDPRV